MVNKKDIRHEDYNAVFWFCSGISLTLYLILFGCAPLIAAFYGQPALVPLARYSFLGFLIASLGISHSAYLFRNLMVKQKALTSIIALIVSGTTGVALALAGFSYWGIATQSIVYVAAVNLCYLYFSPWRPTLKIDFRPLKGMIGFSSRLLVTNIFTHINNNLFSVLLGRLFSVQQVGYYTQAAKWNMMGYNTINGMITGVAQPVLAQVSDDKARQLAVFRKMLRFTSFLSFPLMLGLAFIARELIVVCVTEKWLPSVPMMQMLCVWGAFVPVQGLFSNLIISRGKSRIYMWNTIVLCLLQMSVLIATAPLGIKNMIIAFVVLNVAWLGVWYLFARRQLALRFADMLRDILPFAFAAGGVMVVAHYVTCGIDNIYLLLGAKVVTAALLYLAVMWTGGAKVLKESIGFIKQRFLRNPS